MSFPLQTTTMLPSIDKRDTYTTVVTSYDSAGLPVNLTIVTTTSSTVTGNSQGNGLGFGRDFSATKTPTASTSTTPGSGSLSLVSRDSTTTKRAARHGFHVSKGVLAGSIVATAVVIGLLTFAATFLLMRKKSPREKRSRSFGEAEKRYSRPEGSIAASMAAGAHRWEVHLPQPADDVTVRRAIKELMDQAEMHVENHYSDGEAGLTTTTTGGGGGADREAAQEALGGLDAGQLPGPLPGLMSQTAHPTALIKHTLAHLLLNPSDLLPPAFTAVPYALANTPNAESSIKAYPQAISRWRVLTAHLHPAPDANPAMWEDSAYIIASTAARFGAAFAPWLSAHSTADRHDALLAVFQHASKVALLLFSQPSDFEFDWQDGADARTVVVVPTVRKRTDEYGNRLADPQVLLQPVLATL